MARDRVKDPLHPMIMIALIIVVIILCIGGGIIILWREPVCGGEWKTRQAPKRNRNRSSAEKGERSCKMFPPHTHTHALTNTPAEGALTTIPAN